MTIKAISLTQPWATLMLLGEKRNETRGRKDGRRPTFLGHRGLLAIHATVEWNDKLRNICLTEPFLSVLRKHGYETTLQHGAVLCIVNAGEDVRTDRVTGLTEQERAFGDYSPNRWCWHTTMVHRLARPIRAAGAQGLWNWTVPTELEDFVLRFNSSAATQPQLSFQETVTA